MTQIRTSFLASCVYSYNKIAIRFMIYISHLAKLLNPFYL